MDSEQVEQAEALHRAGKFAEAERICRGALRDQPGDPDALRRLGLMALDRGQGAKAIELLARASRVRPDSAAIQADLGRALLRYRQFPSAVSALARAIELDPTSPEDHVCLAEAWCALGRTDQALEVCERARLLGHDDFNLSGRIAQALQTQGKAAEAVAVLRRAVEAIKLPPEIAASPAPGAHSALLFSMHYAPECSPEEIAAEHRRFSERYETPFLGLTRAYSQSRNPDRRLKIGYLSADYRRHPVATFLRPVIASHNRERFEILCYSTVPSEDAITREFRELAGAGWRDIRRLSDDQAAELIWRDQVDVLVDTVGHTGSNRLMVFARRPAPIQVTWLGYPDTTGLRSIQYRITDAHADPPGMTEHFHSEQLLRLPVFLSYVIPEYAPEPGPPPAAGNGFCTFGCFNNVMKLSAPTLDAWAAILRGAPNAKLLMKHVGSGDQGAREAFTRLFESRGVAPERIAIARPMPAPSQHLRSFGEVDIALDPWPYNGTTTSCETIAMGVPIVALAGRAHVSRVSVSLLHHAGLDDWIASSPEEYVRIALAKSLDVDNLANVRAALRGRLRSSPLGDISLYMVELESAFRRIWRDWCLGSCSD